jgi:hypothetical protein
MADHASDRIHEAIDKAERKATIDEARGQGWNAFSNHSGDSDVLDVTQTPGGAVDDDDGRGGLDALLSAAEEKLGGLIEKITGGDDKPTSTT